MLQVVAAAYRKQCSLKELHNANTSAEIVSHVRLSVKDMKGYVLTDMVTDDLAKNATTKFRTRRRMSGA